MVVRPNLTVVIQVGLYVDDTTTSSMFKFYLQSLLAALREYD